MQNINIFANILYSTSIFLSYTENIKHLHKYFMGNINIPPYMKKQKYKYFMLTINIPLIHEKIHMDINIKNLNIKWYFYKQYIYIC